MSVLPSSRGVQPRSHLRRLGGDCFASLAMTDQKTTLVSPAGRRMKPPGGLKTEMLASRRVEQKGDRPWLRAAGRVASRQPLGVAGGIIVLLLILSAISATQLAPYDPKAANFEIYHPPRQVSQKPDVGGTTRKSGVDCLCSRGRGQSVLADDPAAAGGRRRVRRAGTARG